MTPSIHARPGGRTARVRTDVLSAVRAELVLVGYAALSYQHVSAKAGVHKTTVYRRWPDKDSLVCDALADLASQSISIPDTGSVAADLRVMAQSVYRAITSADGGGLLRAMVSAGNPPAVRRPIERFWNHRFAAAAEIVQGGITRGELARDVDPEQLLEALVAPLFLRVLVTQAPVDDVFIDRTVTAVMALGHP